MSGRFFIYKTKELNPRYQAVYTRGKTLTQLLETFTFDVAMEMTGYKTKDAAREAIRFYEFICKLKNENQVALPECPTCRAFHEHNHGGLTL